MNFEQSLAYLLRLGHETVAIKFGLENTKQLLDALGNPHLRFPKVQIAGTNGKGSTAVMLEAICRAAGLTTGLYTSPHLVSITERVRINEQEISESDFARLATHVADAAQRLCDTRQIEALPTFFEHVTAIALCGFREILVEIGILETGLGGRLDATTAALAEVVAITPIALDHQEYLGQTIEEIAAEKAAVIRPGVAAVIAPQPERAMNVIVNRCATTSVKPMFADPYMRVIDVDRIGRHRLTFKSKISIYENVLLNLPGRHQAFNAAVAIGIAETLVSEGFNIPGDAIVHGLETAKHPGRLEWQEGEPAVLFDGAHNAAGAIALRAYLDEFVSKPITLLFGCMREKELSLMASTLFPAAENVYLTTINNPRSASLESLTGLADQYSMGGYSNVFDNARDALNSAIKRASPDGLVCVTGSLYLIGEVKVLLRQRQLVDYAT